MFLRRHSKRVSDANETYWSLIKTVHTAKGPYHEWVALLGKLTLDERSR